MSFLSKAVERHKDKQVEDYIKLLLENKIHLKEIPSWLRMDSRYAWRLHAYAFRADRNISKAQYLEDLAFLRLEILQAEQCYDNPELKRRLDERLSIAEMEFEWHCDKYPDW